MNTITWPSLLLALWPLWLALAALAVIAWAGVDR